MKTIWKKTITLDAVRQMLNNTLCQRLGMDLTEIGGNFIKGTMPVDSRTVQPMGLLHGGASAAFAESLGSIAGMLACNEDEYCVGVDINVSHLHSVSSGVVTGAARPLHLGQRIQIWDICIHDGNNRKVCVSRLTLSVLKNRNEVNEWRFKS
ncbi:putative esterase [invertebrate metagenome]|uniref:Putative esterase n=1 Tax=invertebrate metagenome TaxID=1711999 RepID=A0A2H9TC06_9ZZZZ